MVWEQVRRLHKLGITFLQSPIYYVQFLLLYVYMLYIFSNAHFYGLVRKWLKRHTYWASSFQTAERLACICFRNIICEYKSIKSNLLTVFEAIMRVVNLIKNSTIFEVEEDFVICLIYNNRDDACILVRHETSCEICVFSWYVLMKGNQIHIFTQKDKNTAIMKKLKLGMMASKNSIISNFSNFAWWSKKNLDSRLLQWFHGLRNFVLKSNLNRSIKFLMNR